MDSQNAKLSRARSSRNISLLIFAVICVAMLTAFLRVICTVNYYDIKLGYFSSSALLPKIFSAISLAVPPLILLFAIIFAAPSRIITPPSGALRYTACIPMLGVLGVFVSYLLNFLKSAEKEISTIQSLTVILAFLSLFFFLGLAFFSPRSPFVAISGVAFIVLTCFICISSYLEFFVPINSAQKLLFQFACCAMIFFAVAEMRAFYGVAPTKGYYFSLLFAIFMLSISAIPSLLLGINELLINYTTLFEDIMMLCVLAYVYVRAFSLMICPYQKVDSQSIPEPSDSADSSVSSDYSEPQKPLDMSADVDSDEDSPADDDMQ